ncbi:MULTISPECIES: hypothetical protein [unclassified Clostridium]|uniref:hypothetical protein n=1 Tax=unclassified Clostridium TaxID=2614128 RepID=UPI000297282C|nr:MULTISPECIES: hypothetical protein [unclassified Clostridium]EKQ51140.1 MAG: hypothetical protein A370_05167 [Clostridium sp. Maddingley MBC34-26]
MEFKLNKIDTDIRRKMQETIKDDKVHSTKKISENKDVVEEKKFEDRNKKNKDKNDDTENSKKYVIVEGIKHGEHSIEIEAEKLEKISEINSKGRILDAKK